MTTLPQTTPMRLPRPAGGGQIAIPSSPGGPMGLTPTGAQMTASDVWRVFRSNSWLIILMCGVAAVAGFFVNRYLAKHYPRYTAAALVKVQLPEEVFAQTDWSAPPQAIEIEQATHAAGMVQPTLMLKVLTDSDKIRQTQWFRDFNNDPELAKENLLKNFSVRPVQRSKLIAVEMTYSVPRDVRTIVEEVISRYVADKRREIADAWNETAVTLESQYNIHKREFDKISAELTNTSLKAGNKQSFEQFGILDTTKYELTLATNSRNSAQQAMQKAQNELGTLNAMVSAGSTPPEIEAEIVKDPLIISYLNDLDAAESEAAKSGGARTPAAASSARRLQAMEKKLNDEKESRRTSHIDAKRFKLQTELDNATAEFSNSDKTVKELSARLVDAQATANKFQMLEQQQQTVQRKMDEVNDQLERIRNRKLPSNYSPVVMFSPPPTPELPTFPKLSITMSIAILAGLGLSVGIAFLRELTDTSVRSPRDIARVGQMNLLGMIPHEADDPQAAGARIPLVIFDAPHSMAAEEFRKIRTRLQHTASLDSTRSILVSSANPGDGKTTIACNLAAGLALNGRRILLVDANFRRPEIHNVFEVANERGLSDALNDLSTFDTLVRDTQVQNLYVMPTGPKPVNATELLESQLLIDFIERALEDYDHVIFDSGPLLIVSETMALAPRVDGVVTVVRARENSRGVLTRMRDALRQVKAEHLGIVLNAVRSQGGGYYGRNIKTYYAYQNA